MIKYFTRASSPENTEKMSTKSPKWQPRLQEENAKIFPSATQRLGEIRDQPALPMSRQESVEDFRGASSFRGPHPQETRRTLYSQVVEFQKKNAHLCKDLDASKEELAVLRKNQNDLRFQNRQLMSSEVKISRENAELKTKLKDLETAMNKIQTKNKFWYYLSNYIEQEGLQPYALQNNLQYTVPTSVWMNTILKPFVRDALESVGLRAQIQHLVMQMQTLHDHLLAKVEKVQCIPDDDFRQNFRSLAASIKAFTRHIKFDNAVNLCTIGEIRHSTLVCQVDERYWASPSRKRSLLEAFIWSVLYDFIFGCPFAILNIECYHLTTQFSKLFGYDHDHNWPVPSARCELWRYTTMEQFRHILGDEVLIKGPPNPASPGLEEAIRYARECISRVITQTLLQASPAIETSRIESIINNACELGLQMSTQRCRLQVVFPNIGDKFIAGATPNIENDMESDDVTEGTVAFITNPGLAKWGDAHGNQLHQRLDIVPSLVFVEETPKIKQEPQIKEEHQSPTMPPDGLEDVRMIPR